MTNHQAFRQTLGAFPTGVTVVTALGPDNKPMGITVNSFASVSLDPPLILWSQVRTSPSHDAFFRAKTMVINILSDSQKQLSAHFARPHLDRFEGVDYSLAECGTPVLSGCAATLVCRVTNKYYGGDHTIYLCQVQSFDNHERSSLIFARGTYVQAHQSLSPA